MPARAAPVHFYLNQGGPTLKPIKESNILKKFSQPLGEPPDYNNQSPAGSISVFPLSPLDLPSETFKNALKRRDANQQVLIQWIRKNLYPDIDYGRVHIFEGCQYARAGVPHQCRDFSHMSMLTLWKSGSEKILGALGLSAHLPSLHKYEDAAVFRQEISQIVLKCELKTLTGKVVSEGIGARHIRDDGFNVNKSIKMASKSAIIDATIRVAGLASLFIKTHRHTVKNNLSRGGNHPDYLPPDVNRFNTVPEEKPITEKQKHLIKTLSGRTGLTTEGIEKEAKGLFNKVLPDLNRIEAHHFIRHLNG